MNMPLNMHGCMWANWGHELWVKQSRNDYKIILTTQTNLGFITLSILLSYEFRNNLDVSWSPRFVYRSENSFTFCVKNSLYTQRHRIHTHTGHIDTSFRFLYRKIRGNEEYTSIQFHVHLKSKMLHRSQFLNQPESSIIIVIYTSLCV